MPNLTAQDIATRENISLDTVKKALKAGVLKGHRIGTRGDWRITPEDYQQWIADGAPTKVKERTE
jgi:excisionase family DNA binding protein